MHTRAGHLRRRACWAMALTGAGLAASPPLPIREAPAFAPVPGVSQLAPSALPVGVRPVQYSAETAPGPRLSSETLSLVQLLSLAAETHPDLAIAYAHSEAARGRLIQAGLYPNPVVTVGSDEI